MSSWCYNNVEVTTSTTRWFIAWNTAWVEWVEDHVARVNLHRETSLTLIIIIIIVPGLGHATPSTDGMEHVSQAAPAGTGNVTEDG